MLVMARSCLRGLFAFSLFALSLSEDPVADFCRRWGHQTAQVNGRLYIDGGQVAYNTIQSNYTNEWLLYSDLNSRSEGGMPRQYSIAKNATVPRLSGGYLWADEVNKCFYQVGGEFFDSPKQFGLFTYDAILNQWNTTTVKNNDKNTVRPAYGAGTQADSRGLGFYYGGWVSNKTSPGWQGPRMALSSMMQFDFTSGVLKNVTHPDGIGRAEGQMVFLPVSDGGVLIYFGGVEDPYRNGTSVATTMTKIHIYDINSNRWYSQTATGDVPAPRRQFCAGVIWADDRSSYNIYIYGGYGFSSPPAFDDAYILSLPSFKWFKGYPLKTGPNDNLAGHGGCTANVVTPNQMLVIGGWFPNTTFGDCDAAELQGQHNMILGNNTGREENGLWDKYEPKRSKYEVPAVVVSAIGGGPTGGATVTAPATWDYEDLRAYYKISFSSPTRTATRDLPASLSPSPGSGSKKKNNLGPILGGVLGGLAVLIAVLLVVLLCFRRRKRARKTDPKSPTQTAPPAELAVGSPPQEMSTPSATKYVAVHERQASHDHSGYSALAPMQSRSLSYDQSSSHSHRQPSYHSTPPIPAPHYGSPHDTSPDHHAFSPSRSPQHNAELFLTTDHGSPNHHTWHDQASPPLPPSSTSPGHRQRQYSYPTPTSPLQSTNVPQQAQVYYPPPPDPGQRQSHQHHLSVDEHRGSPEGTQYSGETQHGGSAGVSNITTPAQFYAQPVALNHHEEYRGGYRR